jgi:hypothetical protein
MDRSRNSDYLNGRAEGFPFTEWQRHVKDSISLTIDLRVRGSTIVCPDIFRDSFAASGNGLRNRSLMEVILDDKNSMIFDVSLNKMSKFTISELRLISNSKFFTEDGYIPGCLFHSGLTSSARDEEYMEFVLTSKIRMMTGDKAFNRKMRYGIIYLTEMSSDGEMIRRYLLPADSIVGKKNQ